MAMTPIGDDNKRSVGRPLRRHSVATEKLSVRLTEHEMNVLRDYCWRHDACASDVVRDALAVMGVIPDWFE